jgi:hypothetical protein
VAGLLETQDKELVNGDRLKSPLKEAYKSRYTSRHKEIPSTCP